ncbi:MAG: hypothetical protein AAGG01_15155, partial [Planctomycetota bacterium]
METAPGSQMGSVRIGLVIGAVGLGLAGLVWWLGASGSAPTDYRVGADGKSSGPGPKANAVEELVSPEAGSQPALVERESLNGQGEAADDEGTETVEALRVTTTVRLTIEPNPWIADASGQLTVHWTSGDQAPQMIRVKKDGRSGGTFKLPAAPKSSEQFSEISLEGLAGTAVQLRELSSAEDADGNGAPTHELIVALAPGATLDWADGVAAVDRVPVEVSLGGEIPPQSREVYRFGHRAGLVTSVQDIELPIQMPRVLKDEPIWVGARERQWRSFDLRPDTERIEIALSPGATIHVLHDEPEGTGPAEETLHVWALAFPTGSAERRPLASGGRTTLESRPSGRHEVWISRGAMRDSPVASRRVSIEVEPGGRADVDLTSAHAEQNLAGIRVELTGDVAALTAARRQRKRSAAELKVMVRPIAPRNAVESDASRRARVQRQQTLNAVRLEDPERFLFEMNGLEPGEYRVMVTPFGASDEVRLVAGETLRTTLEIAGLGRVVLLLPETVGKGSFHGSMRSADGQLGDPKVIQLGRSSRRGTQHTQLRANVVPGQYTATLYTKLNGDTRKDVVLRSDLFTVTSGETTKVDMTLVEQIEIAIDAVEIGTEEPIALEIEFWSGLSLATELTKKELARTTRYRTRSRGQSALRCRSRRRRWRSRSARPASC